jgi:hypothetical protein
MSDLPLESLADLDCVVVRAEGRAIDKLPFTARRSAGAVLIHRCFIR